LIAVIVGYKLKWGVNIQPTLMKLRTHAMTYLGFIKAENLISTKDEKIAAIIYSWETIEDWHIWENSSIRQEILQQTDAILLEQPRVTVYQVVPTTGWTHQILDD
jgi:heme-degrading monooxygenase HmoA